MMMKEILMALAVGYGVGIIAVPIIKLLGIDGIIIPAAVGGAVSAMIAINIRNRWRAKMKE